MVKDTIIAELVVDNSEDVASTWVLCEEAMDTLTDRVSEDWLLEDAIPAVVVGELT